MPYFSLTPDRYTKDSIGSQDFQGLIKTSAEDCLMEVSTDGVQLDLGGAVLDGEGSLNSGVYVHDCQDVTIKNGMVKGFYFGIRAVNVDRLRIENCIVSDNHNPKDVGWLPDTVEPEEQGFGGGIYLFRVTDSILDGNRTNGNFNGISLVRCDRNQLKGNNASHCANVGIHLLGSSDNLIERNQADHCIRYTGRFWCDTADTAGILLEEHSHHNRIVDNSMRYSGDGLFIRANNLHGCNHNYVARNDGSFSPNNAFEAVFSRDNVFEENVADFSNYGFWLGFSTDTVVSANRIRSNRLDGIAIDSGSHNQLLGNEIEGNRTGIRLWCGSAEAGSTREKDTATGYHIQRNRISNSRDCALLLAGHDTALLEGNVYHNNHRDVVRETGIENR